MPITTDAATCRTHRDILGAAARCETAAARFIGDTDDKVRARTMLTTLAGATYTAATVFELDPTLASEHRWSPRFRNIDLLVELTRQMPLQLQNACSDRADWLERWPVAERWAEAQALYDRALEIAAAVPDEVPRSDHATPDGQRAISLERLIARRDDLARASALIHDAVEHALELPHPDPRATELAELAARITHIASALTEPVQTTSVIHADDFGS